MSKAKKLAELLRPKEVSVPTYSVFIGNCYLRHGGCVWCSSHSLLYQTYLCHSSYSVEEAVPSAYVSSLAVVKQPVIEPKTRSGT